MMLLNITRRFPTFPPVQRLLVMLVLSPLLASCMHQQAIASDATAAADTETPILLAMSKIDNSLEPGGIADAEDTHHDEFAIGPLEDQTLWGHIRDGFVIESGLEHERTRSELEWYRSHKQLPRSRHDPRRALPALHPDRGRKTPAAHRAGAAADC